MFERLPGKRELTLDGRHCLFLIEHRANIERAFLQTQILGFQIQSTSENRFGMVIFRTLFESCFQTVGHLGFRILTSLDHFGIKNFYDC
jgi:hypothetical protein